MYELTRSNGDILPFTKDRDRALTSEHLQLFGLEHPVIVQMLNDAANIPASSRALICAAPDSAKHGFLVVWKVDVQSATGKNEIYLIRIGMSVAGERLTALEGKISLNPASASAAGFSCPPASMVVTARNILMREMEYEGVIPEGSSYSIQPLAIYMLQ